MVDGNFEADLAAAIAASSREQQAQDDSWTVDDRNRAKAARLETQHRRWSSDDPVGEWHQNLGFVTNVERGVTESLRQGKIDTGVPHVGGMSVGAAWQQTRNEAGGLAAAGAAATTVDFSSQMSGLTVASMERAIALSLSRVLGPPGQTSMAYNELLLNPIDAYCVYYRPGQRWARSSCCIACKANTRAVEFACTACCISF